VCELDAAGNAVAGVVFGAKGLLVHGSTGYQFDPQGNAAQLLDDDGLLLAHLAYDAWGQLMSGSNPTPFGYKGQWGYYTDGETGILLLTHRYLERVKGKFLTGDMIILADQRYTTYRTMLSRLHKADILYANPPRAGACGFGRNYLLCSVSLTI